MSNPDPVHAPAPGQSPPTVPIVASTPIATAFPLEWREGRHWYERRRLERLVRRCFTLDHGARIRHFLPRLFGLWEGETPLAAVGAGRAIAGPLFQEHYLDEPVETFLSRYLGRPVSREAIAEIGNLVSLRRGLQRRLFVPLIDQLVDDGLEWVLFTATPTVANGIRRLGIELHPLHLADPTRLGDEQAGWGRYYEHQPRVMAGDLRLAHKVLTERGLLGPARLAEVDHAPWH
ncbi:thermostable hemolysin [Halomonas sp. CS7]|uniref:Thermostable hemolysin n=1 Tax=Halomonas pelophila TaxID=3151122 RepID=A0ABV1N0X7_9GAMM